jgi:hypothetical protein
MVTLKGKLREENCSYVLYVIYFPGVVHMDDLIYLVPLPIFNVWPVGHPDKRVRDMMVTLWTNFAAYG